MAGAEWRPFQRHDQETWYLSMDLSQKSSWAVLPDTNVALQAAGAACARALGGETGTNCIMKLDTTTIVVVL